MLNSLCEFPSRACYLSSVNHIYPACLLESVKAGLMLYHKKKKKGEEEERGAGELE
jgi:hypothetical protein